MKLSQERIEDKRFFQQTPLNERKKYIQQMLKIQQLQGQQPVLYQQKYKKSDFWKYKDYKLNYYYIKQSSKPKAVVFYFHGMYCHANESGYFGDVISKNNNVDVYALDFMNAGKSEGQMKGYYESVESLVDQADLFISYICKQYENTKIFISGHSMGGLVCFKLAVKYPQRFEGAILLAPAIRQNKQQSPFLKKLGRLLGYCAPKLTLVDQDYEGFTKYRNLDLMLNDKDRYLGPHIPKSAAILLWEMQLTEKQFSKLNIPYVIIQGGIDKSIDPFAAIDLQKESPSKDKTTIYFRKMWHDALMEEQSKQTCEILSQWLKQRI